MSPDLLMNGEHQGSAVPARAAPFFQRADWASFAATSLAALAVYTATLAPDVGLEDQGHYSVAAMYPGAANAPGFPLWITFGWLFTKLPFGTVAWRLALASAISMALACGFVALLVSRNGILLASNLSGAKTLSSKNKNTLRIVCGSAAGLGFGFDAVVWQKAVIPDPWPLSLLLFAITLALLTRWFHAPDRRGYLYAAALCYGLTLCNNQIFIAAMFGWLCFLAARNRDLGRDVFLGTGILLLGTVIASDRLESSGSLLNESTVPGLEKITAIVFVTGIVLSVRTRRVMSEWKSAILCGALVASGLSGYLLLPIFSMTNPPMNWGYPRTVEGFFHLITRGQYEKTMFNGSLSLFFSHSAMFFNAAVQDFGLVYLAAGTIPLFVLGKAKPLARRWVTGLALICASLSALLLIALNPAPDRQSVELIKRLFGPVHFVIAILAGCGFCVLGTLSRGKLHRDYCVTKS